MTDKLIEFGKPLMASKSGSLVVAVLLVIIASFAVSCSTVSPGTPSDISGAPASGAVTQVTPSATASLTPTPVPPTSTATWTPSPTPTITNTPTVTVTPTTTETPTGTAPPPTPSGDDAIYVYAIQNNEDNPKKCDYIAVRLNTGAWRSGDTAADVARALRSLFVKRQWFGALYNPAYLSNIRVDSVEFKPYSGLVSVNLSGSYVRTDDRCDDGRVRAQVWSTIRQFPGVKSIHILLNGNLLGDILARGR